MISRTVSLSDFIFMNPSSKNSQTKPDIDHTQVLSRREYQEILLARMAAGDLYANELRMRMRRIDIILDKFREKPLYPHLNKTLNNSSKNQ